MLVSLSVSFLANNGFKKLRRRIFRWKNNVLFLIRIEMDIRLEKIDYVIPGRH